MEQIKRSKKAGFPAFNQMARWDLRAFKAQMMLMASGSDKSGLFIVTQTSHIIIEQNHRKSDVANIKIA